MPSMDTYEEIPFTDDLFPIKIIWDSKGDYVPKQDNNDICLWHEQLEILVVNSGKISVNAGYNSLICEKGDIVIINPCEPHMVSRYSENSSYHCIMIDPRLYDSGKFDLCGMKYILPMSGKQLKFNNLIRDNEKITDIMEDIVAECQEKKYAYEVAVKGSIIKLIAELYRSELSPLSNSKDIVSDNPGYETIQPVFSYVAEHFAEKITLEELAGICCLNNSYFCRLFKKVTGKTAVEYVNEYRVEKAKILLITTEKSLFEIAIDVGYSDCGYFSRIFKKSTGLTPGKYRSPELVKGDIEND